MELLPDVPPDTVQTVIAQKLAQPIPTQIAAAIISSPYFNAYPFNLNKLRALLNAFRHALHIHYKLLDQPTSLFTFSTLTRMGQWTSAILKGLHGGQPLLRLVSCSGLLLALGDLKLDINDSIESEAILSLAEIMDLYQQPTMEWEQDWNTSFPSSEGMDMLTLALIISAQSLVLISPRRLEALPLPMLLKILSSTISTTFQSGTFLSSLGSSSASSLISPPLLEATPSISKLTSLVLSLILQSRRRDGLLAAEDVLQLYCTMAQRVEGNWLSSSLSSESSELTKSVWTVMKTMLFSIIMVTEATLSSLVFVPPIIYTKVGPYPSSLSLITLHTLSHLSFVVSRFGGLTTSTAPQESFKELKHTFYLALDILACDKVQSERFVRESCTSTTNIPAKTAYLLACVEQLVPVLSVDCIQNIVFPFCQPHLYDANHRETFESAHSVILAIFAAHSNANVDLRLLAEKLVPFYAICLIENSKENQLNIHQLQLAFANLVLCAVNLDEQMQSSSLARYCVDSLLDALQHQAGARLHRLHLMLISSVSSLSLRLLPLVLEKIRGIITAVNGHERRELMETLFREIIEKVGDREKEFVMRWWSEFQVRPVRARI